MTDPSAGSLVLGRVVDVRIDPTGLQARLQWLQGAPGLTTAWIHVVAAMAGSESGVLLAPEPGDVAVVGHVGSRPLILGFLTGGSSGAPTTETSERVIASRDRNMVVLVDGAGSGITIRDSNDNVVVMSASGIEMSSPRDITIEAGGVCAVKGAVVELN